MAASQPGTASETRGGDRSGRRNASDGPESRGLATPRARQRVLGEALFTDAVVRERRRADRSGDPFAVILVDRGDAAGPTASWDAIVRAAVAAKRDIDVLGWLDADAALGLLVPEIADDRVTKQEVIFAQLGRVRDIAQGPDGYFYIALQNPTGAGTGVGLAASTPGMVIRLLPVTGK